MTSLFARQSGGPSRTQPVPPSSFRQNTLRPIAASDAEKLNRRVSRTDLDFEQALETGTTLRLSEGVDVNTMGIDMSPSPKPPRIPASPTVVPPTPSPAGQKSTAVLQPLASTVQSSKNGTPSPESSSNDLFYDAVDDPDVQTKRRSMFRSPGMASSPDLATVVRKAKEKAKANEFATPAKSDAPQPSLHSEFGQSRDAPKQRQRSATSAHPKSPNRLTKSPSVATMSSSAGDEWVLASAKADASFKDTIKGKSSVRARTSAFLGKMLGAGTTRERSRTDASYPSTPITPTYGTPLRGSCPPPVPPLPPEHRSPLPPSLADVFNTPSPPTRSKPLPGSPRTSREISPPPSKDDTGRSSSSRSSRSRSPDKTIRSRSPDLNATIKAGPSGIRESTDVGEVTLRQAPDGLKMLNGARRGGASPSQWEAMLDGLSSDISPELTLTSQTANIVPRPGSHSRPSSATSEQTRALPSRPKLDLSESSPASTQSKPTLTINSPPVSPTTVGPPRLSSLPVTGSRHRPALSPTASPRLPTGRYGPPSSRNLTLSPGDSSRLRVQHRSTASSSEPHLPLVDEIRHREHSKTVRLVPSATNVRNRISLRVGSQQDLPTTRFPLGGSEENADTQQKGTERAFQCWNEDEDFLPKEKIAEWLGSLGEVNKAALHQYMEYFDFSSLRLDQAFRRLCAKLYLKAETQQLDRVLEEFSNRYWDCNPGGLFGSASVVHAVSYSLLLLNTDLHIAELSSRMSRQQFVRNTMATIQAQLRSNGNETERGSNPDLTRDDRGSVRGLGFDSDTLRSHSKRSGSLTSWTSVSRDGGLTSSPFASSMTQLTSSPGEVPDNGSSPSITRQGSFDRTRTSSVHSRQWDNDMENLLKDMYNAVKSQQILQPLGTTLALTERAATLSPGSYVIRSHSQRSQQDRLATFKRGSIRGLQTLLANQAASPYGSNHTLDGRVSPSPSFATSNYETFSASSSSFLTPTLGFASNLSHTIIREAQEDDIRSLDSRNSDSSTVSITDEELALLGAPWAKEGMLCRKQYWESSGKRAKSKTWMDVFVVIQKGELNMFTFKSGSSGTRSVVGGGNWLANAVPVGDAQLAHSLAHVLPPPGYSRQRPHCFVLTLSNGGVYFFQAGTEELVNEWVSTCNYWAARQSKEPLAGGVSNMEYGWNKVTNDPFDGRRSPSIDESRQDDATDALSVRSGRSRFSRKDYTLRGSPYHDRTHINDWKAPLPPSVASMHDEETQLEALQKHVASLKTELKTHNDLREPMTALYQPRSTNGAKALSNWEKKSQYLLTEIVKYDSYIDSLKNAMSLRLKKRGDKALERALKTASPQDEHAADGKWAGPEETIDEEADEPSTPGPTSSMRHQRFGAGGGSDS